MTSPVWQLDRHHARLRLGQLTATIDLLRPAEGLTRVHLGSHSVHDARLLGIEILSFAAGGSEPLSECRVCGSRLTAVYRESENWPVRVHAKWEGAAPSASKGPLATIDLVVSVETSVLDGRPALSVRSDLPATDIFRLVDAAAARFGALDRQHPSLRLPDGGPGCLLFRLPGSDVSYAEMAHPLDAPEERLQAGTGHGPMVHLRHRLFRGALEKGVILRARVRGVFIRRDDDTQVAAQSYASFAEAEPPLGP